MGLYYSTVIMSAIACMHVHRLSRTSGDFIEKINLLSEDNGRAADTIDDKILMFYIFVPVVNMIITFFWLWLKNAAYDDVLKYKNRNRL